MRINSFIGTFSKSGTTILNLLVPACDIIKMTCNLDELFLGVFLVLMGEAHALQEVTQGKLKSSLLSFVIVSLVE